MDLNRFRRARRWPSRPPEERFIKRLRFYDERHDIPDDLAAGELAVTGAGGHFKWVVFRCPCGRGHDIVLNLQEGIWPRWRLTLRGEVPSLRPSVNARAPFGCHFWLHDGHVYWARFRDEEDFDEEHEPRLRPRKEH